MPDIKRVDKDELNLSLSITIQESDYERKLKTELNKYRKSAQMKGFRKGKTPISVIKKMYGDAVLNEVVNEVLQESLFKYIEDQKIEYLGQPILAKDHPVINISHRSMGEYEFHFDLGLIPKLELEGISASDSYSKYVLEEVPQEKVDEDLNNLRNQFGESIQVEEDIQENDLVKLEAKPFSGNEEAKVVEATDEETTEKALEEENAEEETDLEDKTTVLSGTFNILVGDQLTEDAKAAVLGKNVGDSFQMNLLDIEKENTEKEVRSYYFELDDEDETPLPELFELTITEVTRRIPAEMNEEFWTQAFGEDTAIDSEEQARESLAKDFNRFYDMQAQSILDKEIQDALLEKNEVPLPDDFLKRWMQTSREEKLSMEEIEEKYTEFTAGLKWSLISRNIQEKFEIKVEEVDVVEAAVNQIRGMYGAYIQDEGMLNNMVRRSLDNENELSRFHDQAITTKVFKTIKEEVTILENEISVADFDAMLEKMRADQMAAQIAQFQKEKDIEEDEEADTKLLTEEVEETEITEESNSTEEGGQLEEEINVNK